MTAELVGRLGDLAENRWGLVTTARAEAAGISRKQMSRLAALGMIVRVAQGVYRVGKTPATGQGVVVARWLALAGPELPTTADGIPGVVAAGESAALLHGLGPFRPRESEFIVPVRRRTRLADVRLRVQSLSPGEVGVVDSVPALTVERTIADFVERGADGNVVASLLREAIRQRKLRAPEKLAQFLAPQAREYGFPLGDGRALAGSFIDLAGIQPRGWKRAFAHI
ncbi:type IV toxin-antitoxin system AbiEi family antitoxin domain-containing protein [Sinomonas sp. ASV322]|uniref:type IV toxin-antitoxin system AbiEi family antitoxin domain-containing protein n=1 Tax=Sinomonas sp. ASV322 TaxID=3041920 RepID=UPI0027DD0D79|nr:type IV toxin-antitoxin system AbiEi family antitoxin domain-containing protein [Sinomonas sp. ASV322]MDQ4503588.1 type IV toxin-antitoxin system AbiEi family antitoxin domain-containing protein [Sinomonas sp. ASV322]